MIQPQGEATVDAIIIIIILGAHRRCQLYSSQLCSLRCCQ